MRRQNVRQVGPAVFLIGLGIIAFMNYWWPGIMFVLAVSILASEWVETNGAIQLRNGRVISAGVMILIGLSDMINFNFGHLWPLVLIAAGAWMLFGRNLNPARNDDVGFEVEKPKHKSVTIEHH